MRRNVARSLFLAAMAWPVVALTQAAPGDVPDRVRLRDGGFARGVVVELAPGDHVTVRLPTGETRRFAWSEVLDVTTADGAPAASGSAAPAAPPSSASAARPPPAPSASAAPSPASSARGGDVVIHLVADAPSAWVEARERWERAPWRRLCVAPCDTRIDPQGLELRVAGEGLRASNPVRVEGERGTVRLVASTGKESTHRLGLDLVLAGAPVAFAGTVAYGLAETRDLGPGVATAGLVALAVGGAAALAGIPFLAAGSTRVRDDRGTLVGGADRGAPAF